MAGREEPKKKKAKRNLPFAQGLGLRVLNTLDAATPRVLKSGKTAIKKAFATYLRQTVLKARTGPIERFELDNINLKAGAIDFFKTAGREFLRDYFKEQVREKDEPLLMGAEDPKEPQKPPTVIEKVREREVARGVRRKLMKEEEEGKKKEELTGEQTKALERLRGVERGVAERERAAGIRRAGKAKSAAARVAKAAAIRARQKATLAGLDASRAAFDASRAPPTGDAPPVMQPQAAAPSDPAVSGQRAARSERLARVPPATRPKPTVSTRFLPGDEVAALAAELSYKVIGETDPETGKVITMQDLDVLEGYDAQQEDEGLATYFISDDEIIVATPGSQRLADWTGPNLALLKGAIGSEPTRYNFERNGQVINTLEAIDNFVEGFAGKRLRFVGHSKGAGLALSAYIKFRSAGREADARVFSTPSLYFRGLPQGFVDGDRVRNYVRPGDKFAGGALKEGASYQPGSIALEFPGGEKDDPHSLATMIARDREESGRVLGAAGGVASAEAGEEAETAAELRAAGDPVAAGAPGAPGEVPPVEAPLAAEAPGVVEATLEAPPLEAAREPEEAEVAEGRVPEVPVRREQEARVQPEPFRMAPDPVVQAPGGRREVKGGMGEPRAGERMVCAVVDPRIQAGVNSVCHTRNIDFMNALREFIENGGVERTAAAVGARAMQGLSRLIACYGTLLGIEPFQEPDALKAEELFAQVGCLVSLYSSFASTRYPGEAFAELSAWLKKNLFPVGASLGDMTDDHKLAQGLRGLVVRLDPSASREEALGEMAAMSGGMGGGGGGGCGGGCGGGGGGCGGGGGGGAKHAAGATAADNATEAAVEATTEPIDEEPSIVESEDEDADYLDLTDFRERNSSVLHPAAQPQKVPGDEQDMFDFAGPGLNRTTSEEAAVGQFSRDPAVAFARAREERVILEQRALDMGLDFAFKGEKQI
jgi:hypothetical protein